MLEFLKKFKFWGKAPETPVVSVSPTDLAGLISENLRLGAEIDSLRAQRLVLKTKIDAAHAARDSTQGVQ